MKIDALDVPEGAELPPPRSRDKPVSDVAKSMGVELDKHYDATIADGNSESTATTEAAFATSGCSRRLRLDPPEVADPLGGTPTLPSFRSRFRH